MSFSSSLPTYDKALVLADPQPTCQTPVHPELDALPPSHDPCRATSGVGSKSATSAVGRKEKGIPRGQSVINIIMPREMILAPVQRASPAEQDGLHILVHSAWSQPSLLTISLFCYFALQRSSYESSRSEQRLKCWATFSRVDLVFVVCTHTLVDKGIHWPAV